MGTVAAFTEKLVLSIPQLGKTTRTLIGCGILFIILGTGNILYGGQRVTELTRLLSKARGELSRPDRSALSLFALGRATDRQSGTRRRWKANLEFYQFVQQGGRYLALCGSGFLVLALFTVRRKGDEEPTETA